MMGRNSHGHRLSQSSRVRTKEARHHKRNTFASSVAWSKHAGVLYNANANARAGSWSHMGLGSYCSDNGRPLLAVL